MIPSFGFARLPSSTLGSPCFEEFIETVVLLRSHSSTRALLIFARATIPFFLEFLCSVIFSIPFPCVPHSYALYDDVPFNVLFNVFVFDNNCVSFIRKFSKKIYLCTCIILFIRYSMKNERKWLNSVCSDSANIFLERSVSLITCQFS